ncbi:MAG TPA: MerR family transcriptional regulator [Candidatus Acidoferrales bacterium]|nr:MerR family transcriptional regulator [Candidatus Acidoferrales bacterium]
MDEKKYTTIEAAKMAAIPRATLNYWIDAGWVKAPKVERINGKQVRYWTAEQVKALDEVKAKMMEKRKERKAGG